MVIWRSSEYLRNLCLDTFIVHWSRLLLLVIYPLFCLICRSPIWKYYAISLQNYSDNEILHECSTSPLAESPDFIENERRYAMLQITVVMHDLSVYVMVVYVLKVLFSSFDDCSDRHYFFLPLP